LGCKATNYLIIVFIMKHKKKFRKHLFKTFTNFEMTIIKFHVKKTILIFYLHLQYMLTYIKGTCFFQKWKHLERPLDMYTFNIQSTPYPCIHIHIYKMYIYTYCVDAYSKHKDILAYYYPSEVNEGWFE